MTRKTDINQLELDFKKASEGLTQAVQTFEQAAMLYTQAKTEAAKEPPVDQTTLLRAEVRRLVGVIASQSGRDFHEAWTAAYAELYKATGFHPVVRSAQTKKKTHLDAVQEEGMLQQLWSTLLGMLVDSRYCRP
jgi:hypothetical protein